jgi:hypothetical protein
MYSICDILNTNKDRFGQNIENDFGVYKKSSPSLMPALKMGEIVLLEIQIRLQFQGELGIHPDLQVQLYEFYMYGDMGAMTLVTDLK